METKHKLRGGKGQEKAYLAFKALPESLDECTVLGLLRFGGQTLLKSAIAAEITEHLRRGYYEHSDESSVPGGRNGYRKTTLDTPIGQVAYDRPLVAHAPQFHSQYHVPFMRRPKEFAEAVCDMYVNGIATGNVKRALKSVAGSRTRLSKASVSRVTKRLRRDFDEWKKRDLSQLKVVYLFLDAIRVKMRFDSSGKQSVMIAYAVLEDGTFETLSIAVRNSESNPAWDSTVLDLKQRGMKDPLLTISDGNDGVIHSIDTHLPKSLRQRCVKHKMENILECVPKENHDEVKKSLHRIFIGATSLEQAKMAIEDFRHRYRNRYPSAIECLERDLAQCLTYFVFPVSHWKMIRTSNRLERMNGEIKRRLKSIGHHPSESGCMALILQVCMKYTDNRKRGIAVTELVTALWSKLRERQNEVMIQLELDLKAA